jgi:plastocyanin
VPGGLALKANGLQFEPSQTRVKSGTASDWTFRVTRDGTTVTEFDDAHGKQSHLIGVRHDLTRSQHQHPKLKSDGTWRAKEFTLPEPGVYRAFVDVVVDSPVDVASSVSDDYEKKPIDSVVVAV